MEALLLPFLDVGAEALLIPDVTKGSELLG
jgi:hypothetical protein